MSELEQTIEELEAEVLAELEEALNSLLMVLLLPKARRVLITRLPAAKSMMAVNPLSNLMQQNPQRMLLQRRLRKTHLHQLKVQNQNPK